MGGQALPISNVDGQSKDGVASLVRPMGAMSARRGCKLGKDTDVVDHGCSAHPRVHGQCPSTDDWHERGS